MKERDALDAVESPSYLAKNSQYKDYNGFIHSFQKKDCNKNLLQSRPRVPKYYTIKRTEILMANLPYTAVTDDDLQKCSKVFNDNYGIWGEGGFKPGQRVKMNAKLLKKQCLFNENCSLIVAKEGETGIHLGHAFVCQFPWNNGSACWITQLVVAANARGNGLASRLCSAALDPRALAWGLATCNPYTVRSLERARSTRCNPLLIARHASTLVEASGIPYVQDCRIEAYSSGAIIDTKFFVDHSEVNEILSKESDWHMGPLQDGEEFLAFVFAQQLEEDEVGSCFPCFW